MPYYTEEEIAIHNAHDDCWVSVFDNVFLQGSCEDSQCQLPDVTQMVEDRMVE